MLVYLTINKQKGIKSEITSTHSIHVGDFYGNLVGKIYNRPILTNRSGEPTSPEMLGHAHCW